MIMTDNCRNGLSPIKAWGLFFEPLLKNVGNKITFRVDFCSFHTTVNTIKEISRRLILVLGNVRSENSILN